MANELYRAVNIAILSKMADKSGIGASEFAGWMNLSQSSIKKMKAMEELVAKTWDYEEVANELRMDPAVFTGDYLIQINTKEVRELCAGMSAPTGIKYTEGKIWETIIGYRENGDPDIRKSGKRLQTVLLNEIGKQVLEEHFEDLQLWKFWDYIRKHKK